MFVVRMGRDAKGKGMWCGNDSRIVRLTGRKLPPRSVRLERAGWSSALNEVAHGLTDLRRAPDDDEARAYNLALSHVLQRVKKLQGET